MKQTRIRLAMLAVIALIAVPALLPATASAKNFKLGTGKVVVRLDSFFDLFISAGYPIYPVAPASMAFDAPGSRIALPITGGTWSAGLHPHGTFMLKGGIVYIHYNAVPTLETLSVPAWRAGINTSAGWTGLINGTRTTIFDEDLTTSTTTFPTAHGHKFVKVTGVVLTYDAALTNAFNSAFSLGLSLNTPFGTATLLARVK